VSAHPYRAATLTAPVAPPWWQRLLFVLDRDWACDLWPWARQRVGGRWCQCALLVLGRSGSDAWRVAWCEVKRCPLTFERAPEEGSAFSVLDAREHNRTIDHHRATLDASGRCTCEVWP